ncbi:MAG TPA: hypothetical protein VFV97_17055 [Rhodanobacteraceae bacterium]|nr:hypothetical protein [Rhodanobacteraceae bacterium]
MKRIAFAVAALAISSVGTEARAAPEGASCASAVVLASNSTYVSDTTQTTNWMTSFGPLVSPSNDQLYTFIAGPQPLGTITPTASSYQFAMYLIDSCADSGTEPPPIRATGTVGNPIDLSSGIVTGARYYLAVTGAAAAGSGANGTVNFTGSWPVTLQNFTVD